MIKLLNPAFIFLSNFLFLQGIYAQEQVNVEDYIAQQFLRYCEAFPREEIFIQTDRTDYIAGEDLWFNLYLMDRQSFTPAESSKIVYFELLNQENRPVAQQRVKIDDGFGPGHIVIPDTLSSGTYAVRAYTNWMKNFLPENCFMMDIIIYNAFSEKAYKEIIYPENFPNENSESESSKSGLTLRVNNFYPDTLEVFIDTDNDYRRDNANTFILFIQTHGLVNHISTQTTLSESTKVSLSKKTLMPGINHITVFSSRGAPILERFIYTPDKEGQPLTVSTSESFKKRSKVSLDFEVDEMFVNQLNSTNLSISVAKVSDNPEISEVNDYMVFGSEFGIFPWRTTQGSKISDLSPEVIDSLLLSVKSNWINWGTVLSDDFPTLKYKPETENHYLSGSLINRNPLSSDSGKFVFMSTPGKEAMFQYAKTNSEADFSFSIQIDDQYKDLIIQPAEPDNNYSIKINSPFSEEYLMVETRVESLTANTLSCVSKMSANYQVGKLYETSSAINTDLQIFPTLKPKRFYGKPDIELIMADYIKLPVMEEVFFELIPGAFMKIRRSAYEISIMDPIDNKVYESPPFLLIDGVPINDPSIIANLDPETVERIDVVKERYFVGDYLFYGIINVISKDGDFSSVDLPDYATRLQYRVIDPVRSFVSPDYSSEEMKSNHIPDFRNTLYWNPSIKPDKDGKGRIEFWTSDIATDYEINIQGITPEGKLISYKKIIAVK